MRAIENVPLLLHTTTMALGLGCACVAISLPCRGQQGPHRLDWDDAGRPQVWTGRWMDARLGFPEGAELEAFGSEQKRVWQEAAALMEGGGPNAHAETIRRRLADLRLERQVGSKDGGGSRSPWPWLTPGEAYELDLAVLMAWAAREEAYPGRWETLVDLRLELGRVLVETGRPEAAAAIANHLLVPAGCALPPYELVPASDALLAQEAAALEEPRLAAFRASLQSSEKPRPASDNAPSKGIEEAVREALQAGRPKLVRELGSRAAPALEELVRADLDTLSPDVATDPLALLLEVRELRGAELALELWERGGYLFKKRVVRAMQEANVLRDEGTWLFVPGAQGRGSTTIAPPVLIEAIWLDVMARLASDPEVARDSMGLASQIAELDGLDERLQRAMIALLDSQEPDAAAQVVRALEAGRGRASVVPILEHGLRHRLPEVRAACAAGLALFPRNDALRALADHPDRSVRLALARSLLGITGRPEYRPEEPQAHWMQVQRGSSDARSVDARDAGCLARLLQDSDQEVREVALQALVECPELSIPSEVLVGLARDSSVSVRARLAEWRAGQPADPALLEVLARDADRTVLERLDRRLQDLAQERGGGPVSSLWSDAYLPALRARLANSTRGGSLRHAVNAAARTPAGVNAVLEAAAESGAPEALEAVVWALSRGSADQETGGLWHAANPGNVLAFVRSVWAAQAPLGVEEKRALWDGLARWPADRVLFARALLADESAPDDLRLCAAQWTATTADAAWRKALLHTLRDLAQSREGRIPLNSVIAAIPARMELRAEQEALLADLIRLEAELGWLRGYFAGHLAVRVGLRHDLALEALTRFGDRTGSNWQGLLSAALDSLQLTDEEPRLELFERLLSNWDILEALFRAIGRTHLAAHLPLLERLLLGQGPEVADKRKELQVLAASALSSYFSDEAAAVLLKGVGASTDEQVREACFAALDTIRRYQDEQERWAGRKSSKQAQAAAIAELALLLLDRDANVRAQAARSVGALGGVELLPKLVNMLKDPAPEVRAAAQGAIDVLTAPRTAPVESPGG